MAKQGLRVIDGTRPDLEADRFEGIEASEEGSTVDDDSGDGGREALVWRWRWSRASDWSAVSGVEWKSVAILCVFHTKFHSTSHLVPMHDAHLYLSTSSSRPLSLYLRLSS